MFRIVRFLILRSKPIPLFIYLLRISATDGKMQNRSYFKPI